MIELWKPIPGYEGLYEAGDLGNIRSLDRQVKHSDGYARLHKGRVRKQSVNPTGYFTVRLGKEGKQKTHYVHALILTAFRGPRPDGYQCCHNDGNPLNNRLSNLRWDTRLGNCADRKLHGTVAKGEKHGASKLTEAEVRAIRADSRHHTIVAKDYGVSIRHVGMVKSRKTWAHLV